jgi:hypothetical protein
LAISLFIFFCISLFVTSLITWYDIKI